MNWSCALRIFARGVAPSAHSMLVRFMEVGYLAVPSVPALPRSNTRSSQAPVSRLYLHASVHEAHADYTTAATAERVFNQCITLGLQVTAIHQTQQQMQGLREGTTPALEH